MSNSVFTLRTPMPVSAGELYDWHSRPLAFQRLQPPWENIQIRNISGAFGSGTYRIELRTSILGPIKGTMIADAFDFQPGKQFQDVQFQGPFAYWKHTHHMIPDGAASSVLEDVIEYRLPMGGLGRLLGNGTVRNRLEAAFSYRHALTKSDLARHTLYDDRPRFTIAVTGSRGLVGTELVPFLTTGGHRVIRLVTGNAQPRYEDGTKWVHWKPGEAVDPTELAGVDAVIHLAGDNVADGRWNAAKKQRIRESRTIPTRVLAESIAAVPVDRRPKVFVSASAIGFFGSRGDETLTEESAPGEGFFPDVCKTWEEAVSPARDAGVRTVNARVGVVLTPKGGALGKQLPAFRAGAGAVLGSGRQWVSWIGIGDLVGAIYHCIMNGAVTGPVNCVAPNPVTNREFTKSLGRALNRPAFFWLPRLPLRVMFGELADEGLLASTKAIPKKLLDTGFAFDHGNLVPALKYVLGVP